MDWIRSRWGEVRWPDAVVQEILGLIATFIVNDVVDDPDIRDMGIVAFWLAIIIGGMILLGVRSLRPVGARTSGVTDSPAITTEELDRRLTEFASNLRLELKQPTSAPPLTAVVTGDTFINEIARLQRYEAGAIDFYPGTRGKHRSHLCDYAFEGLPTPEPR